MRTMPTRMVAMLLLSALIVSSGVLLQKYWDITRVHVFIESYGVLASFIFVGMYVIATLSLLPAAFMGFVGGYIFGFSHGLLLNIIGSSIGAVCAFMVGRYIATDWVKGKLNRESRQMLQGVESMGWKFVALFRLTPIVPFDILNFAIGITNLRVWHYFWSSVVFMLPGMITYTYLGNLGLELFIGQPRLLLLKASIIIAVLALIVIFLPKILQKLRDVMLVQEAS